MNRRDLLKGIPQAGLLLFAGCGSRDSTVNTPPSNATASDTTDDSSTPVSTDASAETCQERVTTTVDSTPGTFSAESEFETGPDHLVATATVTQTDPEESPHVVEVSLSNRSTEDMSLQSGAIPPFSSLELDHLRQDASVFLLPTPVPDTLGIIDSNEDGEYGILPEQPIEGCWESIDRPVLPEAFERLEINACDSYSRRFSLLSHASNSECFPRGSYARTEELDPPESDAPITFTITITVDG